jgi:pyridinium-3,5-bisthiocarboxylic acid mononucleotide nickel chelatase
LHFDCFSGISGDMTVAALVGAGADCDAVLTAIASLHLPVKVKFRSEKRGGMAATYFAVIAEPENKHRHFHHIEKILAAGQITGKQRDLALRIFRRLAEAEAKVHSTTIEKVHFHEVGAADSIVDIVATAVAFDSLKIDRVTSRSVPTGSGTVKCDHGIMPVPTPATAELLIGVPLAASCVEAELTTPTGAAILASLVQVWTDSPAMTIQKIGVGAGTKDFPEHANVLRVFVGDSVAVGGEADSVVVLETNLDSVPGEVVGFTVERLFRVGALDVYVIPMQMKKGRPGTMIGVIAPPDRVADLEAVLFRETGTLGIRRHTAQRTMLPREIASVSTAWGLVAVKRSRRTDGTETVSPEYEDCARIARENNIAIRTVMDAASDAAKKRN